jgi:hypothetical protein
MYNFLTSAMSAPYTHAREVLGEAFISPVEVKSIEYGLMQLLYLHDSFPRPEVVRWCKEHGGIIAPSAPDKNEEVMWLVLVTAPTAKLATEFNQLPVNDPSWVVRFCETVRGISLPETVIALRA